MTNRINTIPSAKKLHWTSVFKILSNIDAKVLDFDLIIQSFFTLHGKFPTHLAFIGILLKKSHYFVIIGYCKIIYEMDWKWLFLIVSFIFSILAINSPIENWIIFTAIFINKWRTQQFQLMAILQMNMNFKCSYIYRRGLYTVPIPSLSQNKAYHRTLSNFLNVYYFHYW